MTPRRTTTARTAPVTLALAAAAALAASSLVSCGPLAPRWRAVVAFDEAFAAARPGLARELEVSSRFGSGPAGLFQPPLIISVGLSEGAAKAYEAALAEKKQGAESVALVTSPLIAKALISNGGWTGDPPFLVPEWRGESVPGLWTAVSDPVPAYAAAGAAAGAFIVALSKDGGMPSCGVVFSESAARPRSALAAFASAFAQASEGRQLYVRELSRLTDPGAKPETSSDKATSADPTAAEAQAAIAELLGSDIRVLFVAIGLSSGEAIKAASRPGLAIGADFPATEPPLTLAFQIRPDDKGIAEVLSSAYKELRQPVRERASTPSAGNVRLVPELLVAGPSARSIRADRLDFAAFLAESLRQTGPAK